MNLKKIWIIIPIVLLVLASCSHNSELEVYSVSGSTMGTTFKLKVIKDPNISEDIYKNIDAEAHSVLAEVNRQMSTYIPSSEISVFNQSEKTDWLKVSDDFAYVVEQALKISEETDGAFDITVGPLVNLWGFGPENRPTLVPTEDEITERMKEVGYKKVSVTRNPSAIKKNLANIYLDLSAVAKGFAVDKLSEYCDKRGFGDYLVEIGGEVRTKGRNHERKEWRIGISTPDSKMGIQKIVKISNSAMATSGDYYNYFEKDGVRFSHTIDPGTGKPITHKLASVSVINKSCAVADALATAITVMGPEKGFEFAEERRLSVHMVVREGGRFIEKMTTGFEDLFLH